MGNWLSPGQQSLITIRLAICLAIILVTCYTLPVIPAYAGEKICLTYITGLGCPNCAVTDPLVLSKFFEEYPDLIVIEYEFYREKENREVVEHYFANYLSFTLPGVPLIIFGKNKLAEGKLDILEAEKSLKKLNKNDCPLPNGTMSFEDLDLTFLPGKPKIWAKNRVLIATENSSKGDSNFLRKLLTSNDLSLVLKDVECERIEAKPVQISRDTIEFDKAIKIGSWIFQWNEEK